MPAESARKQAIKALVSRYGFNVDAEITGLPLTGISFGADELEEAIETLLSGWITMGNRVAQFERDWAAEIGVNQAVAVNSGSSALLVMLSAAIETGILNRGDEVIVPAVGWSTSLFSIAQVGLTPVVVDVDIDSLCLQGSFDRPVLAVHLLGALSQVKAPIIFEDACGAHGAMVGDKKAGSLGISGAFSFFFSHHLTTGEGGMITTDDDKFADACRSIRAHGWIRERSDSAKWAADYPELDSRFLFSSMGYNLRMTDIAGAFGIHQVPKLEQFVQIRNRNHQHWCDAVDQLGLPLRVFPQAPGTRHAGFAFPIMLDSNAAIDRPTLCGELERRGIQTRPISGANLTAQPAFSSIPNAKIEGSLEVAERVQRDGFFVGQSHAFGDAQLTLLVDSLREIFQQY